MTSQLSNPTARLPCCAISGYIDVYGTGVVASVHIVDECLAVTDEERYSASNRIWLTATLHQLYDARRWSIDPASGLVRDTFSATERKTLNFPKSGFRIDPALLTPRRKAFLSKRINEWDAWQVARHAATAAKKEAGPPPTPRPPPSNIDSLWSGSKRSRGGR